MVIADASHFSRPVSSIEVVPLGATPIDITFQTPSSGTVHAARLEPGSALEILQGSDVGSGLITIEASVAAKHRRYQIYVGRSPDIDVSDIDQLIDRAQQPLLSGEPAVVESLLNVTMQGSALRERYARGFAEWLLAANVEALEHDWRAGARRIEQAYSALRVFATPLA
jgi:hypothetical protein